MSPRCDIRDCEAASAWSLIRVETEGAVNSFCCKTIDTMWTKVCDDHLLDAMKLARRLHGGERFGVNVHVEEQR